MKAVKTIYLIMNIVMILACIAFCCAWHGKRNDRVAYSCTISCGGTFRSAGFAQSRRCLKKSNAYRAFFTHCGCHSFDTGVFSCSG